MNQARPGNKAGDQMVIRLDETEMQRLGVQSVEVTLNAVTVRFAGAQTHDLGDVFHPEVAGIVRSICDGAAHAIGSVDRPDFVLRVGGLVLQGYRIDVALAETGRRRFCLRFTRACGNSLGVFRISPRSDKGLALFTPRILSGTETGPGADRLFDDMLSQLYLPLVNLNAYLRHLLDGSVPGERESLVHSIVQLKTRSETFQSAFDRLISERMVDRYVGSDTDAVPLLDSTAA